MMLSKYFVKKKNPSYDSQCHCKLGLLLLQSILFFFFFNKDNSAALKLSLLLYLNLTFTPLIFFI